MLCRLANYHPSRFIAYVLLDVPYGPPGRPTDYEAIKALNEMASKALGHAVFGYWFFFDEPDAPAIIDSHVRSIVYCARSGACAQDANFSKDGILRDAHISGRPIHLERTHRSSRSHKEVADTGHERPKG